MREAKEIIKEIRKAQEIASINYDSVPYSARQGTAFAVRVAKEELPKLLEEYRLAMIPDRLVALFASGDEGTISKVSDFLTHNGGIVLDAAAMYKRIADRVEPSYSKSRTFGTTQFALVIDVLHDILGDLDLREIPSPQYREGLCPDYRASVNHIRDLVRQYCTDSLNFSYIKLKIADTLVKGEACSKQVPILVLDVSSPEEKALIGTLFNYSNTTEFTDTFVAEKKTVLKLFKQQSSQTGDNAATEEEPKGE